jgi:hypothetical protein
MVASFHSMCRSQLSKRNYDPICLEDIGKFAEDWILEDDPQVLNVEEIERYRKGLVPNDKEILNAIAMNGNVSLLYLSFLIYVY